MQRHTLRGLLADTWQDSQGVDELADQRTEAHGVNGRKDMDGLYTRAIWQRQIGD